MNMEFERRLAIPAEVKEQYPLSGSVGKIVEEKRAELRAVFEGRLDKLLLIIGPCSADNEDAVLDYMNRLVPVQEKVRDKIFMVPRIYTNKPRTTGEGYKGMLHQPDPNAKPDLYKGIVACRHMHMRAVEETGFSFIRKTISIWMMFLVMLPLEHVQLKTSSTVSQPAASRFLSE